MEHGFLGPAARPLRTQFRPMNLFTYRTTSAPSTLRDSYSRRRYKEAIRRLVLYSCTLPQGGLRGSQGLHFYVGRDTACELFGERRDGVVKAAIRPQADGDNSGTGAQWAGLFGIHGLARSR